MSKANALHEVFSRPTYRLDYATAKSRKTCIVCGRPAARFSDGAAALEYAVSAICQECQDRWFSFRGRREGA